MFAEEKDHVKAATRRSIWFSDIGNSGLEARRCRAGRLCPFGNKVPNCTKDKANAPLGVCSVLDASGPTITCPIRFRERWMIAEDAARFFFPPDATWTSLMEVRLKDWGGNSAGNIDMVLVSYDSFGRIQDFGSLEVQAVYISGNVRNPFEFYMRAPEAHAEMDWSGERNYPSPDYLSSSRKRLAPQLLFKGGILNAWGKKSAVALDRNFFETLPEMESVEPCRADLAWFVYDLAYHAMDQRYHLTRVRSVYTKFGDSLRRLTISQPGRVEDFISILQTKLDEKMGDTRAGVGETPPDTVSLEDLL
jgi:Restriction endonuclease NotI.